MLCAPQLNPNSAFREPENGMAPRIRAQMSRANLEQKGRKDWNRAEPFPFFLFKISSRTCANPENSSTKCASFAYEPCFRAARGERIHGMTSLFSLGFGAELRMRSGDRFPNIGKRSFHKRCWPPARWKPRRPRRISIRCIPIISAVKHGAA